MSRFKRPLHAFLEATFLGDGLLFEAGAFAGDALAFFTAFALGGVVSFVLVALAFAAGAFAIA